MQLSQQRQTRAAAGRAPAARGSRARAVAVRAAKTANGPRIAIVGVTGAVGQEFLTVRLVAGYFLVVILCTDVGAALGHSCTAGTAAGGSATPDACISLHTQTHKHTHQHKHTTSYAQTTGPHRAQLPLQQHQAARERALGGQEAGL